MLRVPARKALALTLEPAPNKMPLELIRKILPLTSGRVDHALLVADYPVEGNGRGGRLREVDRLAGGDAEAQPVDDGAGCCLVNRQGAPRGEPFRWLPG